MAGYESVQATLTSNIDHGGATAGVVGNVFMAGVVGAGINGVSGAMYAHKPNPLVVKLERTAGSGIGGPVEEHCE